MGLRTRQDNPRLLTNKPSPPQSKMKDKHRIGLASPPDREKLVAEIFFGDMQWAEINQERGDLEVEFYPRTDGKPWELKYDDAVKALNQAKQRLMGSQGNET